MGRGVKSLAEDIGSLMNRLDYGRASVVLYDPVHVNLRTTRYALTEIGFREILSLSSLAEFRRRLEDETPALIIAETSQDPEVYRLIRDIRLGECGDNPFVAILLTSWLRDGQSLKSAITSGADDVIVRPFSTTFAEERIRTLVKARKPFIVTSDYVGPDRRKDGGRGGGAQPIEAPNTLRALAEHDDDALRYIHERINDGKAAMAAERIRRLCMRVIVGVEVAARELAEGRGVEFSTSDMLKTAKELRLRMMREKSMEAVRIVEALVASTVRLSEEGGFTKENLLLAKELSFGAYAAASGGRNIEQSVDEIEQTVETLRKRLNYRAPKTGDEEGDAELKRAAS
jgi:DNA-binding response OmpR family regulator